MWGGGALSKSRNRADVHYRPTREPLPMPDRPAATPFSAVLEARLARREFLKGGLATAVAAAFPLAGCTTPPEAGPVAVGFTGIPPSSDDALKIAPEYDAIVLYRWGDPVGIPGNMPAFRMDASNTAAEQEAQAGMHHDGMFFYPLPAGSRASAHGLLAMNHEYVDDGLLHPDGRRTWNAEKVRKCQAAFGVSVIEVRLRGARWEVVRPSRYARRITAYTPCAIAGPAAGSDAMKTAFDPFGREVLGTYDGCANGYTPWGTYLTCEENWNFNFVNAGPIPPEHRRYGVGKGWGYRWETADERFDAARHPNEPNRFGWIVEIDPYDPRSKPVKRTALGRIKHEGAHPSVGADGRIAFYMGDDESFEYIYKFVTARAWDPANRAANRTLLDDGVLWVQTDISPTALLRGDFAPLGNNAVLAADPATGELKRFMVGPRGCEITGFTTTPDNRTAFVNIQHPGENPGEINDPDKPRANSNWPDFDPNGRPRSATVVIRRKDGGEIGT